MPTFDEIREHIKSKYKVAMDEPGWLGLAFSFTLDGRDVVQRERVEPATALGKPAVLMWSDIISHDKVPHKVALQRNGTFELGGVAISADLYVFRVVLPLDGLSFDTLDNAMVYVAREAARLREGIPLS
ncbi:MAG: hypothetical protein AB7T06_28185 [Kofleriaceae bacterium]